jgi:hypothetical protein
MSPIELSKIFNIAYYVGISIGIILRILIFTILFLGILFLFPVIISVLILYIIIQIANNED